MTNHKYNIGDICKVVSKSPYLDGRIGVWSGDEYLGQEVRITDRRLLRDIEPVYAWDCVSEGIPRGQYILHEDSLELVKAAPQKPSWGPEYQSLIDTLREMGEEEAADYLENEAWKLDCWMESPYLAGCFVFDDTPQGAVYWRPLNMRLKDHLNSPKPHERTKEEALKGIRRGVRVKVVSCEPLDETENDVWWDSEDNAATHLGEILTVGRVDSEGDVRSRRKVFDPRHLEVLSCELREGDVVDHPEYGRGVVIEHSVYGTSLLLVHYGEYRYVDSSTKELTYTGYNIFDLGD